MWSPRKTRISLWLVACAAVLTTVGLAGSTSATRPAKSVLRKPVFIGAAPTAAKPATPSTPAVKAVPARSGTTRSPGDDFEATPSDEKEILIMQALDQPASLKIQSQPITEAVRLLSENTGVPIEFDRFVLGCLPYGSKTQITATISNQPLRDSLYALLRPLACKFGLDRDKIVIQPRPALFRIARRATWEEVALIEKLYNVPWSRQLADSLTFQFQDMPTDAAEANRKKLCEMADTVGSGSAARVLDIACDQFEWVWHPEASTVTICTRVYQVERAMGRLVTVRYSEVQLKDVLLDLAQRAGILLRMDPGVLAGLPVRQSERFHLTLENVSIRQAFELVAGETGLGYVIESKGIRITPTNASSNANPSSTEATGLTITKSANPIIGQVPIPGVEGGAWFIREEDLPPGANQKRLEQLRRAGEQILAAGSHPAE